MTSTDTFAPDDATSFASLALNPALLENLDTLGYREMTTIQAQSLPSVLAGRDLIAQAKTGSGNTAAFGLGILNKLNPAWFAVQALVLCPTRELADQVANELRRLARSTGNVKVLVLTGGSPMRPQIASLEHGPTSSSARRAACATTWAALRSTCPRSKPWCSMRRTA